MPPLIFAILKIFNVNFFCRLQNYKLCSAVHTFENLYQTFTNFFDYFNLILETIYWFLRQKHVYVLIFWYRAFLETDNFYCPINHPSKACIIQIPFSTNKKHIFVINMHNLNTEAVLKDFCRMIHPKINPKILVNRIFSMYFHLFS